MQGLDAAHLWHSQIQQDHVGRTLRKQGQCFFGAGCGSKQLESRLFAKHAAQSCPYYRVVINDKQPDWCLCLSLVHEIDAPKRNARWMPATTRASAWPALAQSLAPRSLDWAHFESATRRK